MSRESATPSDPAADPVHCALRLRASVAELSRRMRPAPQHGGISVAKLSVLGRLYRSGPLTATELAQREGVRLQSLTRLLAELEAEGWLARKADAVDGRRWLLRLTALGARRLSASVKAGEASLAEAVADRLDAAERRRLLEACALLDRVAEALEPRLPDATESAAAGRPARRRSSSEAAE